MKSFLAHSEQRCNHRRVKPTDLHNKWDPLFRSFITWSAPSLGKSCAVTRRLTPMSSLLALVPDSMPQRQLSTQVPMDRVHGKPFAPAVCLIFWAHKTSISVAMTVLYSKCYHVLYLGPFNSFLQVEVFFAYRFAGALPRAMGATYRGGRDLSWGNNCITDGFHESPRTRPNQRRARGQENASDPERPRQILQKSQPPRPGRRHLVRHSRSLIGPLPATGRRHFGHKQDRPTNTSRLRYQRSRHARLIQTACCDIGSVSTSSAAGSQGEGKKHRDREDLQ